MIDLPLALALPLAIAAAGAIALAGYALGVTRFLARLQTSGAGPGAGHASADAPLPAASRSEAARPPGRVHTVILDGIAESGKSTLVHRLAFPCTSRASLIKLRATREAVRTRVLPVCFEAPAGGGAEVLHSLRFSDVSGERPGQIGDTIDALHGEDVAAAGPQVPTAGRAGVSTVEIGAGVPPRYRSIDEGARDVTGSEPRGKVVALWVWDISNTPRCRAELTPSRMRAAYGTAKARELIKGVVVFFNKVDLLEVEPDQLEQLLADEERHLRGLVSSCFDQGVPVVFHRGSALDGTGVTDCQGALLDAIGLGHCFRIADGDPQGSAP